MYSENVLRLIRQAARRGERRLDLSHQRMTRLPEEIAQASQLTHLNLQGNILSELPSEIAQLSNLKNLDISNNQLKTLPREITQLSNLAYLNLCDNKLITLPSEIAQLYNLEELNLSKNQLVELFIGITQLIKLKRLNFEGNRLTALPSEIAQLSHLRELNLRTNQLSKLPLEICQLNELRELDISKNQLTSLPPLIDKLTNLKLLNLSSNPIVALPPEIASLTNLQLLNVSCTKLMALPHQISQIKNLFELNLYGNSQLTSPPPEIVQQGLQAVLTYLREGLKGHERQWISKLLVVGQGGVGKTTLINALTGEAFNNSQSTTQGIEIKSLELAHPTEAGVTMQLNTWDFGGQEIYHATNQFFFTDRSLFLLAWNVRHGFEQGKLYYWLNTIKALAPKSPILLVATQIDHQIAADIPLTELQSRYPHIIGQCEISSMTGVGIEELRWVITEAAAKLPLMGEIWPRTWVCAASAIRSLPDEYITPQKLWDILANYGMDDDSKRVLAQWLHELGEILYFQDNEKLNNIVILKPQWVTKYICKVLLSQEVVNKSGIFTRSHMDQIWYDLSPSMREHFLQLMECFDLSYQTLDNQDVSLVVERLPLDPPDYKQKWDQIQQTGECNEISIKFQLDTMPAGIPTWFIARQHRFTTNIHWRNGALLTDGTQQRHLALVQAFPQESYIQLTVRGLNPLNFFMLLKDGIKATLARFPGLKIVQKVPCLGHDHQSCPHEFNYEQLVRRYQDNRLTIECPEAMQDVSVPALLCGLDVRITPRSLPYIGELENTVVDRQDAIHTPSAVVLQRLDLILQRLDQLETEVVGGQGAILDKVINLQELTQREFTKVFRHEQAKIESHCP